MGEWTLTGNWVMWRKLDLYLNWWSTKNETFPPQISSNGILPTNEWYTPKPVMCTPKWAVFSKNEWILPPNEWCFPKVLHTTPKGVMLTLKWVMVSKNEGRSSEPNDDPKGANFSLKWVILPQNGCSPQNELYSPKILPQNECNARRGCCPKPVVLLEVWLSSK